MGNNPISGVDPDGGFSWLTASIGTAVGAGIGYAATEDWEGALVGGLVGATIGGFSFSNVDGGLIPAGSEAGSYLVNAGSRLTSNPSGLTSSLNVLKGLFQGTQNLDIGKASYREIIKGIREAHIWMNENPDRDKLYYDNVFDENSKFESSSWIAALLGYKPNYRSWILKRKSGFKLNIRFSVSPRAEGTGLSGNYDYNQAANQFANRIRQIHKFHNKIRVAVLNNDNFANLISFDIMTKGKEAANLNFITTSNVKLSPN